MGDVENGNGKKKGRPVGVLNGQGRGVKWTPKKWKPIYETIVALHCVGYTQKEISKKLFADVGKKFTPTAIGLILRSPQALAAIELFKARVKEDYEKNTQSRIDKLTQRAMENVECVLSNDKLREESPFALFNSSIKYLEGIGKLTGNQPKVSVGIVIGGAAGDALSKSIEKSDRVLMQHLLPATGEAPKLIEGGKE